MPARKSPLRRLSTPRRLQRSLAFSYARYFAAVLSSSAAKIPLKFPDVNAIPRSYSKRFAQQKQLPRNAQINFYSNQNRSQFQHFFDKLLKISQETALRLFSSRNNAAASAITNRLATTNLT
jgi:hypothetical protein